MQGSHRQRKQVYGGKHPRIHSLRSLVNMAKERTIERVDTDISNDSVRLPLLEMTNRLMNNLQVMHHHLQSLLIQKLSPDARNVIAAERAWHEQKFLNDFYEHRGSHLTGLAREHVNDLECLNEYRERYAGILGELLVAKDRLVELERGLESRQSAAASRRKVSDLRDMIRENGERRRRSASTASSSAFTSSDSESEPEAANAV
jgi:hypothetical protein